jgi:hypothetical protein
MASKRAQAPRTLDVSPRDPWERQIEETDEAFKAFARYRDMEPKRSTTRLATEMGVSENLIHGWSSKHRWVGRVAEWDREKDRVEKDRVARAAQLSEIRAMQKRHVDIALLMQALGATELKKRATVATTQPTTTLETDEAQRVLEAGVKLERLTRGEPTDVQATQNDTTIHEAPVDDFLALMRDPEYRKHLDAAARRAERMARKPGGARK